jgi:hypothetical protein
MPREGMSARRVLLVLLVLCATLSAQAASLNAGQETHHGSEHCCALCHMGPIPSLPAVATAVIVPLFAPVWLADSAAAGTPREVLFSSAPSRAPPA